MSAALVDFEIEDVYTPWAPAQTERLRDNPKLNPKVLRAPIRTVIVNKPKAAVVESTRPYAILIVDDEPHIRQIFRLALEQVADHIEDVDNDIDAIAALSTRLFDVVLLDLDLSRPRGMQILERIRAASGSPHLKVLVMSGKGGGEHLSLLAGADDFLAKPFNVMQLRTRVAAAIRLKTAQDRNDVLTRQLALANSELEQVVNARDGELIHARSALILALCHLVEQRSRETGPHLIRIQRYMHILGEAAVATPAFHGRLTEELIQTIEAAAPLHDIGKVVIPDAVLNKPGTLTLEERVIMQTHAAVGAETLSQVTSHSQFASTFLHTAAEIARHHHERWDGTGYPDKLAGDSIPLAARMVAIGDVYDALRSQRVYKLGYSHEVAVERMMNESPGHFDPALLEVFARVAARFEVVFNTHTD